MKPRVIEVIGAIKELGQIYHQTFIDTYGSGSYLRRLLQRKLVTTQLPYASE